MEYMELEVYSQSIDRGVIRMPSQSFPGLVLQGETLSSLLRLAKLTCENLPITAEKELIDTAQELVERIQKLVSHYESTLRKHNIPLPYSTIPSKVDPPN
jgi:predicted RNase H-like HicB family nuclease